MKKKIKGKGIRGNIDYTNEDYFYASYVPKRKKWKKEGKYGSKSPTREDYKTIIGDCNQAVVDHLLQGGIVKFPHNLGTLHIGKFRKTLVIKDGKIDKTKLPVNWKKTWEVRKKIYGDQAGVTWCNENLTLEQKKETFVYDYNEVTDGWIFKVKWAKAALKNISVYKFIPTKAFRVSIYNILKDKFNKIDYPKL